MSACVKEAAPASDAQLISTKAFHLSRGQCAQPRAMVGAVWRGRQGGADTASALREPTSRTQARGHPLSISGAPAPEPREKEQTLGAASRPGCLERGLGSQGAKVELRSCHLLSQSLHCPPKCWHQAVLPRLQPGLLLLPLPGAQADLTLEVAPSPSPS